MHPAAPGDYLIAPAVLFFVGSRQARLLFSPSPPAYWFEPRGSFMCVGPSYQRVAYADVPPQRHFSSVMF